MKKICISTWYQSWNYGTGLQAVALSSFLEERGYECYFLEDDRIEARKKEKTTAKLKNVVEAILDGRAITKICFYKQLQNKNIIQIEYMEQNNKVFTIKDAGDIEELNKQFDIFIIGGDQVLNPYFLEDKHLLTFVNNSKHKFSYGSSVGVEIIPESLRDRYIKYLGKLDYISVREKMSMKALSFLNKPVQEVIDPTMLLDKQQWNRFLQDARVDRYVQNRKYILGYFIGNNKQYWKYLSEMKKCTNYPIVIIPINHNACWNMYHKCFETSPKEFLWLIKNAEIICTDSFHATIFSLLFEKEFYTLKRFASGASDSQNGRIQNILEKYDMKNRFIDPESQFIRNSVLQSEAVKKEMDREREESVKWLEKALRS